MHFRKIYLVFLVATILLGVIACFCMTCMADQTVLEEQQQVEQAVPEEQQNTSQQFAMLTDQVNVVEAKVLYKSPYDDIYDKIKNAEMIEVPENVQELHFYPDGFTEDEQYTYDELVNGVRAEKESVWVPIRVDVERITPIAETMYMAPDIIGLDREVGFDVKSNSSSYVIFPPYCVGTSDEMQKMEQEMAETAQKVYELGKSLGMTDNIRDYSDFVCLWLAANCQYSSKEEYTANDRTAYGALIQHEAVCIGYANAYQYLMGYAGYETALVLGIYDGEKEVEDGSSNHAWIAYHDGDTLAYCDPTTLASRKQKDVIKWDEYMYFTDLTNTDYIETKQLWYKPVAIG